MILEEEVANVKDSVTSGLPSQEQTMGGGATGFGGALAWIRIGQSAIYTQKSGEDTEDEKKLHLWPQKPKKKGG